MNNKISSYLELPIFSKKMKNIIEGLIIKKNSKIALVLNSIYEIATGDYYNLHEKFKNIESIRMLDLRKDDDIYVVSYLALGKEPEYTENGKWSRKNRQQGKIGKVIKSFIDPYLPHLSTTYTQRDLELFVNEIKSYLAESNLIFKLVSGEDIRFYYHEDQYANFGSGGTLHNSCMRYEECQKYFDMYVDNPNCELLIVFDKTASEEKIVARALVWEKDGMKYMDRRYYIMDLYEVAMIDYAKSNGMGYKAVNVYDEDESQHFKCPNDDGDYESMKIRLCYQYATRYDYYPYGDSMKWWSNSNELTNYHPEVGCKVLNDPDGNEEYDEDYEECACCGDSTHMDDLYYSEVTDMNYCYNCVIRDYNGDWIPTDDSVEVVTYNGMNYAFKYDNDCVCINDVYYLKACCSNGVAYKLDELTFSQIESMLSEGFSMGECDNGNKYLYKTM